MKSINRKVRKELRIRSQRDGLDGFDFVCFAFLLHRSLSEVGFVPFAVKKSFYTNFSKI